MCHINRSAVIEGLHRHDTYELPTQSIREIIANACLHRSYLDSSAIQVSIYDDRLEVDSPGMLYDDKAEFAEDIDPIDLDNAKIYKLEQDNQFHTKRFLEYFCQAFLKIFVDIRPLLRYIIYCPLRK